MLECHVYVGGKQVGTALCWGEALRLWLSGSLKPLEELRASVERELGPARVVRHAAYMPLHTSLVLEYVLETSKGEESVLLVCAEDPETTLREYNDAKGRKAVGLRGRDDAVIKWLSSVARENYFNVHAIPELEKSLEEVVGLVDDVEKCWRGGFPKAVSDLMVRSAFLFSLFHVIWPLSLGVMSNLLIGNLPACFMQLRLLVETAAKALLVDYKVRFQTDAFTGVEALEEFFRSSRVSTSRVLSELSKVKVDEGAVEDAVKLWNKLSEEWVHFRGYVRKLRKAIEEYGDIQSYGYGVPNELSEEDASDLGELAECLASARRLLRALHSSWLRLLEEHPP
jgi:hypothetical protein